MKILKSVEREVGVMRRKAQSNKSKNLGFEDSVEYRYRLTSGGNIAFDGWLKEQGTWYPGITNGFQVQLNPDGDACINCHPNDRDLFSSISEDLLIELLMIEENQHLNEF